MAPADVTIVIPTYNAAPYIGDALRSIGAQTTLPKEVVVVDDASTDDTLQIAESVAEGIGVPTRVIRLQSNSGTPSRPMNVGVRSATTEFIAVLDHDDVFMPSKLEDEVGALVLDRTAAFAWSCSAVIGDEGRRWQSESVLCEIREKAVAVEKHWRLEGQTMLRLLLRHGCFPMGFPGFTFRKDAWARCGGVDERLRIADHGFLCSLCGQGASFWIARTNYLRRLHERNLSSERLAVARDFVSVVVEHLRKRKPAQLEPMSVREVRDQLTGIAYLFRDAGQYLDALACHVEIARIWGCRADTAIAVSKLVPHWLLQRCSGLRGHN
jgi:glycosyltransferase involved in cell wall biosynthesis